MVLSVIIVSYNVRYFLEQALHAVLRAATGIETEVLVIDNNSPDNSVAYLEPLFPQVAFIGNRENAGFAKACNQGLERATGQYILFLNPDTILPEDCFRACITFINSKPDAGALGVRMVDGSGRFLKESKRAFPSPVTSLFKLAGLSRLFPHSRTFSKYHLGHLDEQSDHQVDVLSGAFMFIRKEVLAKTGGFDETFFMYGEDIDLSYRIQEAGYKNYYFAGTTIIHFKGESTRKASANYVKMFYEAMSIFVRKHYGKSRAGLFNGSIQLAITLRGLLSATAGFMRRIGMPLIDALLIILSFTIIKQAWNAYVKTDTTYDPVLVRTSFAAFAVIYLVIAYYAGLYDRWYKTKTLWKTAAVGVSAVLVIYSLLPEDYRFSRAVVLFGSLTAFMLIAFTRHVFIAWGIIKLNVTPVSGFAMVMGSPDEIIEARRLLQTASGGSQLTLLDTVNQFENGLPADPAVLISKRPPGTRELVFCVGQQPVKPLISLLPKAGRRIAVRIHYAGSGSMVGSESAGRSGEVVSASRNYRLCLPFYRRLKRLTDVSIALPALLLFPIQLVVFRSPLTFLSNCLQVLLARKTWISYGSVGEGLPALKAGVLAPDGTPIGINSPGTEYKTVIDQNYALQYEPAAEIRLLFANYRKLGN